MRRGEVWFAATPSGDRPVLVLSRVIPLTTESARDRKRFAAPPRPPLSADRYDSVVTMIREVIEAYIAKQERAAWEDEARRVSVALAREAQDPSSAESEHLRMLEANLAEFAKEWVWEDEA